MSEKFLRFKRRARIICLIKAVSAGLSLGLSVFGSLFLLSKFEIISTDLKFAILMGAGAFLLAGTAVFLLLRVTDKSLAKALDERFGLSERVRTMLAKRSDGGTMLELQREDTEAALANIPLSALKFKRLWLHIPLLLIGAAIFTASLVFSPPEEPPAPEPEVPFSITETQILGIEELISYVDESDMKSPHRENISVALSELLAGLRLVSTVDDRDELLDVAMQKIVSETNDSSTIVEVLNTLWESETAATRALVKAMNAYNWKRSTAWDDFGTGMSSFKSYFVHPDSFLEEFDEAKMNSDISTILRLVGNELTVMLAKSDIPSSDPIAAAVLALAEANISGDTSADRLFGLVALSNLSTSLGYDEFANEIQSAISELSLPIFSAINENYDSVYVGEVTAARLSTLFGNYPYPTFERPKLFDSSDDEEFMPDDENDGSSGGGITGDIVYGSNELVLDIGTDTYVEYGTILKGWADKADDMRDSDDYTAEEKEAIKNYFDILYNGYDD